MLIGRGAGVVLALACGVDSYEGQQPEAQHREMVRLREELQRRLPQETEVGSSRDDRPGGVSRLRGIGLRDRTDSLPRRWVFRSLRTDPI